MVRAILFDMGGTLDGDGTHWLDRFDQLYASAGHPQPRERLRAAFDDAERRAASDEVMASAPLETMIARHVGWQFAVLDLDNPQLQTRIVDAFVAAVRTAAREHEALLQWLHARALTLGVVSNGCGNVDVLCQDLGYAPYLSVIIDSRRVGVAKPDPAIYRLAVERLSLPASCVLMVGDSYERDVVAANTAGLRTAWLAGRDRQPAMSGRVVADHTLTRLDDLRAVVGRWEQALA